MTAGLPEERWGVRVVTGDVPEALEAPTYDRGYLQMDTDRVLVLIPDLGRMLVTREEVVLEPLPERTTDDMAYLVYGWASRFLLVLREEFCLHASAVRVDGGALGVMGHMRAGKSTTVTGLAARGHEVIVDDVLPVRVDGRRGWVHGWDRPIHLLPDAAERLGLPDDLPRLDRADEKIVLASQGVADELPLRLLVELVPTDDVDVPDLTVLRDLDRVTALRSNMDATGMASSSGRAAPFFQWVTAVADAVPVVRIRRPREGWHLDPVLDLALAALRDVP